MSNTSRLKRIDTLLCAMAWSPADKEITHFEQNYETGPLREMWKDLIAARRAIIEAKRGGAKLSALADMFGTLPQPTPLARDEERDRVTCCGNQLDFGDVCPTCIRVVRDIDHPGAAWVWDARFQYWKNPSTGETRTMKPPASIDFAEIDALILIGDYNRAREAWVRISFETRTEEDWDRLRARANQIKAGLDQRKKPRRLDVPARLSTIDDCIERGDNDSARTLLARLRRDMLIDGATMLPPTERVFAEHAIRNREQILYPLLTMSDVARARTPSNEDPFTGTTPEERRILCGVIRELRDGRIPDLEAVVLIIQARKAGDDIRVERARQTEEKKVVVPTHLDGIPECAYCDNTRTILTRVSESMTPVEFAAFKRGERSELVPTPCPQCSARPNTAPKTD